MAGSGMVDSFREFVERLWARLASLVGETATAAIVRSAVLEAARAHPVLGGVHVDASGVQLDRLRENPDSLDSSALRAGFLAFAESAMSLMSDLTGDILARKVEPLVQQFKRQLEGE